MMQQQNRQDHFSKSSHRFEKHSSAIVFAQKEQKGALDYPARLIGNFCKNSFEITINESRSQAMGGSCPEDL